MHRFLLGLTVFLAAAIALPDETAAQETSTELIEVGTMAPDFELVGATRHGVLRDQIKLSNYLGDTVVLAFFFRVRTRG